MSIPIMHASTTERVEARNQTRTLENFLNYRFDQNKKLALLEEKVHGHAITTLKEIDQYQINWESYPGFWFHDTLNFRKITQFITDKIPLWEQEAQNHPEKMVLLEKQCALFERLVGKYNQAKNEKKTPEETISFVNPFRKKVEVILHYPALIGSKAKSDVSREVEYDRLTTADDLRKQVSEAIDKPVFLQIPGSTSANDGKPEVIAFTVVPKTLFKNVVQEPQDLFDPADGQLRDKHLVVKVSYDDPDPQAVNSALYKAGEQKTIPHVYEQGFVAGKIAGHSEAMLKVHSVFTGKS